MKRLALLAMTACVLTLSACGENVDRRNNMTTEPQNQTTTTTPSSTEGTGNQTNPQ